MTKLLKRVALVATLSALVTGCATSWRCTAWDYKNLSDPSDSELNALVREGWRVQDANFTYLTHEGMQSRWVSHYLLKRERK